MSRGKRHTPEQIVVRLREADALLNAGQSLGQVIQHLGVSEATYHRWRNQYGGTNETSAWLRFTKVRTGGKADGRKTRKQYVSIKKQRLQTRLTDISCKYYD